VCVSWFLHRRKMTERFLTQWCLVPSLVHRRNMDNDQKHNNCVNIYHCHKFLDRIATENLLMLFFSLFTTCFGPFGPSSGETQLYYLYISRKLSILQRIRCSQFVSYYLFIQRQMRNFKNGLTTIFRYIIKIKIKLNLIKLNLKLKLKLELSSVLNSKVLSSCYN
jgi:hypothetical protein